MNRKLFAVLLTLTLLFTAVGTAYGAADPGKVIKTDWYNFRGNYEHNAVTESPVPTSAEDTALLWATKSGDGFGSNAIGSPILVDGYLYYNQGKTINKMDAVNGQKVLEGAMVANSSFSIIPPTYADGMIFVGISQGRIQAFDAETLESLWLYTDKLGGQPNSPITYHDGYIYTGFWNSETRDANYVCVNAKTGKVKWTYTNNGGYYWAGSYVCDDFLLVGTDDGDGGYTSQTSSLLCLNPKTGKLLDEVTGLNADIRCNVSYDKATDRYYFTCKGGSFYSVKVSSKGKISDLKELDLGGMSTSTPAIYNGRAYVGVSGPGQFAKYNGHNITVIDLDSWTVAYKAYTMGYPQTSGLVYTGAEDGYTYVYFFENMTPGKIRYIKDKPGQTAVADGVTENDGKKDWLCAPVLLTFQGEHAQYAICSPIVDEYGTIYFKNDSAHMMAAGSKITEIKVTEAPNQTVYDIGDTFNPSGMKVEAVLTNGLTMDISQYVTYDEAAFTGGEIDVILYYNNQLYNDVEGDLDQLFTTVDITVNDEAISSANNALKEKIKAAKPSVTLTAGSKAATVSWKKVNKADGYQIQRSTKKSSGFKTVKTIKKGSTVKYKNTGLKSGKTYYYKVRAYKVINGVKYYSKWSTVKNIKVK